jgi:hypothetical protein
VCLIAGILCRAGRVADHGIRRTGGYRNPGAIFRIRSARSDRQRSPPLEAMPGSCPTGSAEADPGKSQVPKLALSAPKHGRFRPSGPHETPSGRTGKNQPTCSAVEEFLTCARRRRQIYGIPDVGRFHQFVNDGGSL